MICTIQNVAWFSSLALCFACSAGPTDESSNGALGVAQSGLKAHSSAANANELPSTLAAASQSANGSPRGVVQSGIGMIAGGSSGIGGAPAVGGLTGFGGAVAAGGMQAGGGTEAGGTSSSCCDKCNTECPYNWVCATNTCHCDCVGDGQITTQPL